MTADGTYRPSTRVTTAEELDGLPTLTVLLDRANNVWQSPETGLWACALDASEVTSAALANYSGPLTVLFRPDAPQPATTDDEIERAALVGQALAETIPDGAVDDETFDRVKAAVLTALAARGDAATTTEVEWGVRYTYPHPEPDAVYPVPGEVAAHSLVADPESTAASVMQRDVHRSAWREVS